MLCCAAFCVSVLWSVCLRMPTCVDCVHPCLALSARLTPVCSSRYLGNNPLLTGAVPTWLGSFPNLEVLYVGIGKPLVCLLTSTYHVWQGHAIHRHVGDVATRAGVARFLGCAHHLAHPDDRRTHPTGTRGLVQCYYSVRMLEARATLDTGPTLAHRVCCQRFVEKLVGRRSSLAARQPDINRISRLE